MNMKYKIGGVQQEKTLEINKQIHERFQPLIANASDKDEKVFKWIEFDKIISYLPLLGLTSHRSISRRFQKYEEYNLLFRHSHKTYNKATGEFGGSYTFIFLQDSFYKIFETDKITDTDNQLAEKAREMGLSFNFMDRTEMSAHHTTIYSNNYTTTEKEKSSSSISKEISELLEVEISDQETRKNLSIIISKNKITFERVQAVITYCKENNKGFGYIYRALKNNWPVQTRKVVKNTKVEKTEKYIEQQQEEKETLKHEEINLSMDQEKQAINLLNSQGVSEGHLLKLKAKSESIYLRTLYVALKESL